MAEQVCKECGYIGKPKRMTKGSFFIELVLWICFLIPGLIYSLWRLTTRFNVCRKCGHKVLIPVDSPLGKQFVENTSKAAKGL